MSRYHTRNHGPLQMIILKIFIATEYEYSVWIWPVLQLIWLLGDSIFTIENIKIHLQCDLLEWISFCLFIWESTLEKDPILRWPIGSFGRWHILLAYHQFLSRFLMELGWAEVWGIFNFLKWIKNSLWFFVAESFRGSAGLHRLCNSYLCFHGKPGPSFLKKSRKRKPMEMDASHPNHSTMSTKTFETS
jgi:hypothetical protein